MTVKNPPTFDAQKLYDNSVISIQLGIEDFLLSTTPPEKGGNEARALSSARNLFAGMLLLFKYKIAISVRDPSDAYSLIFNPPASILPQSDGNGGVEWIPVGKFRSTTIDVAGIEQRFKGFGITVDWKAIEELQDCRNHLEHLHPKHTLGEVAGFIANLFPVLTDFISKELNLVPLDVLGEAWNKMLKHKDFYSRNKNACEVSWNSADFPKNMKFYLLKCSCDMCGSKLLKANEEDLDAGLTMVNNEEIFKYRCLSCGYTDLIAPLLRAALRHEHNFDYSRGEDPTIEQCLECKRETFLIFEQQCPWCEAKLDHERCDMCGTNLTQLDQDNNGLCSYHYNMVSKVD